MRSCRRSSTASSAIAGRRRPRAISERGVDAPSGADGDPGDRRGRIQLAAVHRAAPIRGIEARAVEVSTHHSGGALDELLTIYTIVDALTVNLPAITRVQILIDGKEVETLAGHVDLRHPLAKSLQWVIHDTH